MTFAYAFTHDLWFAAKVIGIVIVALNLGYIALMETLYRVRLWRAKRDIDQIFREFETERARKRPELVQTVMEQKRKAWR